MQTEKKPVQKTSNVWSYVAISVIGFVVSLLAVYYYLQFIQGKVSEQVDQKIFYLILILFGIAASSVIFGIMNSYAVLKGEKLDTKFRFTGPIVGVILTVLGGFYLPSGPSEKVVTIRVFDEKNSPVSQGEVKLYLPGYIRSQSIDNMGQSQFADLPEKVTINKVRLDISSPGYLSRSLDTTLQNTSVPVTIYLSKLRTVTISGRIKDAAEIPVRDVEINVDGTRFDAQSITDGTYSLRLADYSVGDAITLTTSHKDFEDKTITLKITAPEMSNIDFVLNHASSPQTNRK